MRTLENVIFCCTSGTFLEMFSKKRGKKGKKGKKKGKKRKMFSLCSHENVLLVQHFGVTKKREKNQMFSAMIDSESQHTIITIIILVLLL